MLEVIIRIIFLTHATGAPVDHVLAAYQAESRVASAELLLAQAWAESKWTGTGVSRFELDDAGLARRRTGAWPGRFPKHFRPPYFCGASQLKRKTERSCRAIGLNLRANYTEARKHIHDWLDACKAKYGKRRANLDCALSGYGSGWPGTKIRGRGYRYARKIQRWAASYRGEINSLKKSLTPILDPVGWLHEQLRYPTWKHHPSIDPAVPSEQYRPACYRNDRVLGDVGSGRSHQCRIHRRLAPS